MGVGQITKQRTIGNTVWDATFTITTLSVPEITGCASVEYQEEALDPSENGFLKMNPISLFMMRHINIRLDDHIVDDVVVDEIKITCSI